MVHSISAQSAVGVGLDGRMKNAYSPSNQIPYVWGKRRPTRGAWGMRNTYSSDHYWSGDDPNIITIEVTVRACTPGAKECTWCATAIVPSVSNTVLL